LFCSRPKNFWNSRDGRNFFFCQNKKIRVVWYWMINQIAKLQGFWWTLGPFREWLLMSTHKSKRIKGILNFSGCSELLSSMFCASLTPESSTETTKNWLNSGWQGVYPIISLPMISFCRLRTSTYCKIYLKKKYEEILNTFNFAAILRPNIYFGAHCIILNSID
jgi:hypothetical protein